MLNRQLKDAATAAFRDNARLAQMSEQEQEAAAQFYEQIAEQTTGTQAVLARLYNWNAPGSYGAKIGRIAPTARQFAEESGFGEHEPGDSMFKFHEGQSVALQNDYPSLGLKAGDRGVVWAARHGSCVL